MDLTKVDFVTREYMGCEIYEDDENYFTIPNSIDFEIGHKIRVTGLCNNYFVMFYRGDGFASTESGSMGAIIERATDDRQCWICGGLMNLKALERVNLLD